VAAVIVAAAVIVPAAAVIVALAPHGDVDVGRARD